MSGRLKGLVNNSELWSAFLDELEERINLQHKSLEQTDEMVGIYRTQGRLEALRSLKKLRGKVNGEK